MKKGILITIIGIIIIGIGYFGLQMFDFTKGVKENIGQNAKQNLILFENDYEIDLTDLDSVRENLNGFWVLESQSNEENLLLLDFEKQDSLSTWNTISLTEKDIKEKTIPITSCQSFAHLLKSNREVQILFVSLGGQDTTNIDYLTKTKFKINGMTYFKHKGYNFLK